MAGFPSRISRRSLGPTLKNRYPVRDNEREIGMDTFNAAWWQIAGMNVASDIAWALLDASGVWVAGAEAWDPDGTTAPTPAHPSTGTYTLTYAATYPDETGTEIPLTLYAAVPAPQTSADRKATATVAGNVVTIYVRNGVTDALVDCAIYVAVK